MSSLRHEKYVEIDWSKFVGSTLPWSAEEIGAAVLKVIRSETGAGLPGFVRICERCEREPISRATREAVFLRDGRVCRYCQCDDAAFHLDHVVPASKGGGSSVDNLVVACAPCNLSKGAKTLEEWIR
jgi:hypothetical protein